MTEKNKDKKITETDKSVNSETKKEIVSDIEKTGVPEKIAKAEEELDEKAVKEVRKTEKQEQKKEEKKETEREYVIPLRRAINRVPRYKRANKAVKTIKEFLAKHMKVPDRNIKNIKLDRYLNEFVWFRGIRNPPAKIKVKAIKNPETGEVRVELFELPENLRFKKEKFEKRQKVAEEIKKAAKPEPKPEPKPEETKEPEKSEEGKIEEKEKKAAVVEAGKKIEKAAAKQAKHMAKISKQPKHQFRKALSK